MDEKKKRENKAHSAGDYVAAGEITGILDKAGGDSITLRVTQLGLQGAKRSNRPTLKEVNQDIDLQLTPDVKVRLMKLPHKTDEKGHKLPYTVNELAKLKGKSNLPGYESSAEELKPGMIVRLHLVRAKGASKDPMAHPFVNRIYIEGEGPPPKIDPKAGDKKKPEKKN
jgi:hypothetical protein